MRCRAKSTLRASRAISTRNQQAAMVALIDSWIELRDFLEHAPVYLANLDVEQVLESWKNTIGSRSSGALDVAYDSGKYFARLVVPYATSFGVAVAPHAAFKFVIRLGASASLSTDAR
jgi:hypothetical protein